MSPSVVAKLENSLRIAEMLYAEGRPELSDSQYEGLRNRWEQAAISVYGEATRQIGTGIGAPAPVSASKAQHNLPMLSLSNVFSETEARAWLKKVPGPWACQPKVDGLALSLRYRDGKLVQAVTRGDGHEGELVTAQALQVSGCRAELKVPWSGEVRGEVYCDKFSFSLLGQAYANARNYAAGSLRLKAPAEVARRGLSFLAYQIIQGAGASPQLDEIALAAVLGIPAVPSISYSSPSDVVKYGYGDIEAKRSSLGYEIDGVVLKALDPAKREALGVSSGSPNWAVAWKFPAEQVETTLLSVEYQVGRTGVVTPVGILDPVQVGGVTVSKVTLNNLGFMEDMGLSKGCIVTIQRAGDVIPELVKARPSPNYSEALVAPRQCPACQAGLVKVGARLYCSGASACAEQTSKKMLHFAKLIKLDGVGPKTVELLKLSKVTEWLELLGKPLWVDEMLGSFSAASKLIAELMQAQATVDFGQLIQALGIPMVGARASQALAEGASPQEFLENAAQGGFAGDIGPAVQKELQEYFALPGTLAELDKLLWQFDLPEPNNGPLQGCKVVFTGALPGLSRATAHAIVRQHGGTVSDTITRTTTLIVVGDKPGSKEAKAHQFGIPRMEGKAFVLTYAPQYLEKNDD